MKNGFGIFSSRSPVLWRVAGDEIQGVNRTLLKSVLFVAVIFLTSRMQSCSGADPESAEPISVEDEEIPVFKFAVAGHAYGNPDTYTFSIYPPFLEKFKAEKQKDSVSLLFLTGDMVKHSVDTVWQNSLHDLGDLNVKWFLAQGNHDRGPDAVFKGGFDSDSSLVKPFNFISSGRNEFMVLNTSNPGWTVDEEQRAGIYDRLAGIQPDSVDNIFVFTHQLWWQHRRRAEFDLDSAVVNSKALIEGESDFWQDVFPLFEEKGIETWFFAGDIGAMEGIPYYYEDHFENFHFYASGMGGGGGDNYLRVSVYENGDVQIERIDF